jgi:hypothetical protein
MFNTIVWATGGSENAPMRLLDVAPCPVLAVPVIKRSEARGGELEMARADA